MPNLNKVMLMGNLTRDIELRYTPSNQPVANLGLAINRQYQTREGEKREETTFVDCEAWGRTAEVMNQYLQKGRPVYIEGRLKLDTWQDQQSGQSRSKMRVVVENFQFIDSRGGGGGGGQGGGAPSYQTAGGGGAPVGGGGGGGGHDPGHQPVSEDDIPF